MVTREESIQTRLSCVGKLCFNKDLLKKVPHPKKELWFLTDFERNPLAFHSDCQSMTDTAK